MHKTMVGDSQSTAGVVGGIEAVFKALSAHVNDAEVCITGCGALKNMTVNSIFYLLSENSSLYQRTTRQRREK